MSIRSRLSGCSSKLAGEGGAHGGTGLTTRKGGVVIGNEWISLRHLMKTKLTLTFSDFSVVLGPWLFLLDEGMDQSGHGPTAKAPWRIWLGSVGISHELQIKGFFGSHEIIVIKSNLLALTAFKEFGHRYLSP